MPDTDFDQNLAQAAIEVIEDREYGHPALYPKTLARLVADVIPQLASEHGGVIPSKPFNEAVQGVAQEFLLGNKSSDDLKTILRAYRLVRQEQDKYRILNMSDLPAPWLGFDGVAAAYLNQRERFRRFAHLHMLAYPEILEAAELFAPPGRSEGDAERALRDRFAFTRKINATIAAYLIDVMCKYELVAPGTPLRNIWAPPTLLAALVVRRYLELTGFAPDRGIETADLLRQCAAVVPGAFFQQHPADTQWYRALRAPADTCLREVGGAQIRIGSDGLLWFTRAGLLAPLYCARVLRERRAKESLARLAERILSRVLSFPSLPVNSNEIEKELAGT